MGETSMQLPPGMTCADCVNVGFCVKFLGDWVPPMTRCDWSPSRFKRSDSSRIRQELAEIEQAMNTFWPTGDKCVWLFERQRQLDDSRPIDLIINGETDKVRVLVAQQSEPRHG